MTQYSLSPLNEALFSRFTKLLPKSDITAASQQQINEFNIRALDKDPDYKNLFRPVKWNMITESYIIPTSDGGAITGYMTRRLRKKSSDSPALIVYLHDGGWMYGNMDIVNAVCSNIANATGAQVLAVDYRMAPQFKFPTPLEDCYDAYMWAVQGTRYWKLDPTRVFIVGNGCGATLACGVSILARDRKAQKPAGQILIDPVTDCRFRTKSITANSSTSLLTLRQLNFFVSNYQREPKDILDPLFSPLLAKDFSRLPATLIISADNDILLDDSLLYEQALKSADTPAKTVKCPGRPHGFLIFPGTANWKETMNAVDLFLEGGINIDSIEIMTKHELAKVRRTRGPVVLKS